MKIHASKREMQAFTEAFARLEAEDPDGAKRVLAKFDQVGKAMGRSIEMVLEHQILRAIYGTQKEGNDNESSAPDVGQADG